MRDFHVLRNQMNNARKCTKRIIASLLREIGWLEQCTIPLISTPLREMNMLEMCFIHVISKHIEISHRQSVLFHGSPYYMGHISFTKCIARFKIQDPFVLKIPSMNSDALKWPQISHDLSLATVELDCGFVVHVVKLVHIFSTLFNTFSCLFWHVLFLAF